MVVTIDHIRPVAHLPLVLGVVRKRNVAALIDTFCPPHPAHVLSCGRGVEALLLAILDGHHALYKVGARLEEHGMGMFWSRKKGHKVTLPENIFRSHSDDIPEIRMLPPAVIEHLDISNNIVFGFLTRGVITVRRPFAL